ncbi:MAG: ethanolamine utilization protein EutJ [Candidatus Adiutrix sp.]|jgi:ethanolamine utilization protein EutJ|nr:ethanolamine utilization protein EutJ [Candidatus Adiutrix sp.]
MNRNKYRGEASAGAAKNAAAARADPVAALEKAAEGETAAGLSLAATVGESGLTQDDFLAAVEKSLTRREKPRGGEALKVGLDLGTASIVLVVLGENDRPLAAARRFAQVVRDGLVVDFSAARTIVEELKAELQKDLGVELMETAIAVPPGTGDRDTAAHRYVASGAGLEVGAVMDEPSAANLVLGLKNGAIVDIGGGTTGVAVLRDGQVVRTFDEATGGVHLSLVLAGHYRISFEEAEAMKQKPENARKIVPLAAPVLQKIGTIIRRGLGDYPAEVIHLVGGTAATLGIEKIIGLEVGRPVRVSARPILVTPAGIALGCEAAASAAPLEI